MQYQLEQLRGEKKQTIHASQLLEDTIHELEVKCQRHLEDKRELKASINDLQKNCFDAAEKMSEARQQYEAVKVKLNADVSFRSVIKHPNVTRSVFKLMGNRFFPD